VAAYFQLLIENEGLDGWFETTWHAVGQSRGPPYAFEQSTNALEDVFGLTSALVTARVTSPVRQKINGTTTVTAMRIGTGEYAALLYALPPFIGAIILVYLIGSSFPWRTNDTSSQLTKLVEFCEQDRNHSRRERNSMSK